MLSAATTVRTFFGYFSHDLDYMKKTLLLFAFTLGFAVIGFSQSTTTFNFTGDTQTYTVPPCVTQIEVVVAGAEGGGGNAGDGAVVTATIDVTPGEVLQINVGGAGNCNGPGFNGGGTGGNAGGANAGCGGGGASDIQVAPYGLNNRIVVAGGGGGTGGGNTDAFGGDGGCATGATGDSPFGDGGTGGTQFSGGNGGPPWITSGNAGAAGSLGNGGNGAIDPCHNVGPGGGGGGGYYGGGGGGSDCFASGTLGGGGGGGGSSLVPAGGGCNQGTNSGDGYITITPNNEGIELVVNPESPEICVGDSVEITVSGAVNYNWSPAIGLDTTVGETVMASPPTTQTYLITADDGADCSDTISVTVEVLPEPVVSINPSNAEICPGESVDLTASGASSFTWSPANGLNDTQGATVSASPASTETYTVIGQSGECSSDTTITVTVLGLPDISFSPENPELCPDGSVEITATGGTTYTWSPTTGLDNPNDSVVNAGPENTTTYTITGTDSNGCTNTAEVTATILDLPEVDAGEDLEICPGTGIELNGSSADAVSFSWSPDESLDDPTVSNPFATPDNTTTYTLEVTDENGCNNTDDVTIEVIDQSFEIVNEVDICDGESYTLPDGQEVETSGTYENLFTSVLGCDSLVITELEVNPVYDLVQALSFCDDETYTLPDGTVVNESGDYPVSLQTDAGCDSTITFEITFTPTYDIELDAAICESQSYEMPDGSEETEAGTFIFDLQTSAGCDSVVTINLEVQETILIEQEVTICDNESYTLPDGSSTNEEGLYDIVMGEGGCDTLYQVQVDINPTFDITEEVAICSGESFTLPDGSEVSSEGEYTLEYTSQSGCDSLYTFDLEILSTYAITVDVDICPDESYTLADGTTVNEEGLYPQEFTNVNGCDSTVNINLNIYPEYDLDVIWNVCEGDDTLDPFGNPITSDDEFFLELNSIYGCDSLVHLVINYGTGSTQTDSVSFCDGEQFVTGGGQIITIPGTYQDVFENSQGCDSVVNYAVTVWPSPNSAYSASSRFASVYDGPVQFFNESTNADSLEWDFGVFGTTQQNDPIIDFEGKPGFYPVCLYTSNQFGCTDQHCFEYEVREDFAVYIPNAFSPNGDGKNELFFVQGKDIATDDFLLQIFNRWGELVFETRDLNDKWDGSSQNNKHFAEDEVFLYRVVVSSKATREKHEFKGTVTVLR